MRGDLVIFVILSMLLLSSCQERGTGTKVGGIDLEFLPNQPPEQLYENSNFAVGLKLLNSLPERVQGVNICVSDILASEYGGIVGEECQTVVIEGAFHEERDIVPEEEVIYFPKSGEAYSYEDLDIGPDETTIFAEVTYPVRTTSTLNVCLKRDPTAESSEIECETSTIYSSNEITSPFAPVTVERIESTVTSEGNKNRVFLEIDFKRSERGEIVSFGEESNLMGFDIGLGTKEVDFNCNTEQDGLLEFDKVSKRISCNGLIELDEEFEVNSLNIETNYDYRVKISNGPINIKKLNQEAV